MKNFNVVSDAEIVKALHNKADTRELSDGSKMVLVNGTWVTYSTTHKYLSMADKVEFKGKDGKFKKFVGNFEDWLDGTF